MIEFTIDALTVDTFHKFKLNNDEYDELPERKEKLRNLLRLIGSPTNVLFSVIQMVFVIFCLCVCVCLLRRQ